MHKQTHSPSTLTHRSCPAQLNGCLSSLARFLCPGLGALVPDQLKPPARQLTGTRELVFNHKLSTRPPTSTGEGDRVLPTVRRATAASTGEKKSDGGPASRKRERLWWNREACRPRFKSCLGWRHKSPERAFVQWSTQAIVATTNHDKPHSPGRRRALARVSPRDGLSFAASLPILPSTFLVNLHGTSVSRTAS